MFIIIGHAGFSMFEHKLAQYSEAHFWHCMIMCGNILGYVEHTRGEPSLRASVYIISHHTCYIA